MLGSQAEDAVGQHIGRWYPESHVHRGLLKAAFRQASLEGRHRYDGWRLRTDGVRFWASTALTAVHDLTGTLAGFGEMTYDLTDRLQVEDERVRQIREQVKRVKADLAGERIAGLLTSISDAFFVVDAAWRFTYVTPQAAPMLYRDQNVLVGQNLWSLFPSVEGTLFQRELRRAMERRTSVGFEARAFSNDRWIEVHAYPAADGLSIYLRDVTARKRQYAEREALTDQLADERARLETVLQQMPAGVIIAESPSGRLLLGNQQAERLLQQPIPLSATIDDPRVWQGTHVDGTPYPLEQQPLYRAATVGDVIAGEEVLYHRGDGTRVWLSMNAAPVRDRLGNIIAGVVAFYDITEQKRTRETQRFLAEASAILSSSLDYETTLHSVAQLAVPTLADWCTVNVLEEDGTVSRLAVVHHGEPPVPLVPNADADRIDAVDMQGNSAVARVLRDGQPLLYPEISEQLLASDINPRDLQVIKLPVRCRQWCYPSWHGSTRLGCSPFSPRIRGVTTMRTIWRLRGISRFGVPRPLTMRGSTARRSERFRHVPNFYPWRRTN